MEKTPSGRKDKIVQFRDFVIAAAISASNFLWNCFVIRNDGIFSISESPLNFEFNAYFSMAIFVFIIIGKALMMFFISILKRMFNMDYRQRLW